MVKCYDTLSERWGTPRPPSLFYLEPTAILVLSVIWNCSAMWVGKGSGVFQEHNWRSVLNRDYGSCQSQNLTSCAVRIVWDRRPSVLRCAGNCGGDLWSMGSGNRVHMGNRTVPRARLVFNNPGIPSPLVHKATIFGWREINEPTTNTTAVPALASGKHMLASAYVEDWQLPCTVFTDT